jgi:thiol-disulfide isomerase/thioredoxin
MPLRLIASLAAAAIFVGACGSPDTQSTPTNASNSSQKAAAGQAAAVPTQLKFTAKTISGQPFSGASLAGKPAVLWFWAPWCPRCRREAPIVGKVAAANPQATFVGVAARAEAPAMQAFVDKYQLGGFTQLADTDGAVWSKFGVTQQPAWAFIGANGHIDVVKGSLTESELTDRVDGLGGR